MTFHIVSRVVREDGTGLVTLQGPDGATIERRYFHIPDVVAVVAVHEAELLLMREFRAAVGQDMVQVPMGKLPDGADPAEHALAELAEGTGFHARRCVHVGSLLSAPGWTDQTMHVFHAEELHELDDERHNTVIRMSIANFNHAVRAGEINDARTIAAVRLALA